MPSKSFQVSMPHILIKIEAFKWTGASRIKEVYGSYLVLLIAFEVVLVFQDVTTFYIDRSLQVETGSFQTQTGLWQVFGADAFEVVPVFQTNKQKRTASPFLVARCLEV
jgi:steroid 5-alpha reductase family enzyme